MSNNATSKNSGVGFCSLLLLLFIALKLTGVISWSWWWVLSPFWIPLAFGLLAAVIYIAVTSK